MVFRSSIHGAASASSWNFWMVRIQRSIATQAETLEAMN